MKLLLLLVLLAPFVSAPLLLPLGQRWGARVGWAALVAPLISFSACLALYLLPAEQRGTISWDWIPRLGAQLSFTPDGLALFFGLLVTGMGVLVTFYAAGYLDDHYTGHGRFYCILQLFMGSMLVTVFSSNLLVLFTAWELTGVTSFFLIGFLHEQALSRRGARMALLTTSSTGLALLVGVVLLQQVFGTLELPVLFEASVPPEKQGLLTTAFAFCFVGIAGKSALVPFMYWLPNAMAAPTPVSAYLHSATMVKLGVFLSARLLPVFVGLESWTPTLVTVGFLTYLLGSALACFSFDLKAVLAYTTVAQLGMLVGQYGWASAHSGVVFGDFLHILNHSLYKACLFMVVGIIDHSAGTRDLRQLGGLFKRMPLTGVTALVGLAAMAGLPLTSGFISKELLLEGGLAFQRGDATLLGWWPLISLIGGSILHAFIALRIAKGVLFGAVPEKVDAHFHAPSVGIQLAPMVLALGVLYFGLQPASFGYFTGSFSPAGVTVPELALWHGFTPVAFVSLAIFTAAGALYWLTARTRWSPSMPRLLEFDRGFDRLVEATPGFGKRVDRALGFTRPSIYLFIIIAFVVSAVLATAFQSRDSLAALLEHVKITPANGEGGARWGVVLLISTGTILAAAWKRPIPQLFAVSLVGFGVAFYYVLYRAPDLALTQLLVESATLLLVLLVVLRFKRDKAEQEPLPARRPISRLVRLGISGGAGLLLGLGVLIFPNRDVEHAGSFYLEQTVPLAKGENAVNTIVVDFRGFDTMLEITVLLIAALGCLGLLSRASDNPRSDISLPTRDLFPVPRDFILRAVAIGAFVPLNLVSFYIFYRGHNAPGGGFVAGLITALSLLLLSFVLGVQGFRRRFRFRPMLLAVAGIFLALSAAVLPTFFGYSLLHHMHTTLGPIAIGTPMLFDAGVFLTVVGVTLKLMLPLMKSVHGLPAFVREEEGTFAAPLSEPIDIDPTRHPGEAPRSEP